MSEINQRTKVALPLMSWWHLAILIASLAAMYFGMKFDISNAISQSAQNAAAIERMREQLDSLRMDQIDIKSGLGYFRQQYEIDRKREGLR